MIFFYHQNSGEEFLKVEDELYRHIFKSRRASKEKTLNFRNLTDDILYAYEILEIGKKSASLKLLSSTLKPNKPNKKLHLAWCIIDPKSIEKTLPFLNELGVDKISFIYCVRSQKSYKLNLEKLNKILINSSSQCGRSNIIKLKIIDSLNHFLQTNDNAVMINFSENKFETLDNCIYLVGCEGGFSKEEIKLFSNQKIMGLDSNLILKSETAITAISSKVLL